MKNVLLKHVSMTTLPPKLLFLSHVTKHCTFMVIDLVFFPLLKSMRM